MISIVIIGLITSYLYGTLGGVRKSNSLLLLRDIQTREKSNFTTLLNRDILESTSSKMTMSIKGESTVLHLQTKNSLYNSHYVYVKWFLHEELKEIIRAESVKDFQLPVKEERLHWVRFDKILENIETFKIFQSSKKDGLLLYTVDQNETESVFEFLQNR
jgi:hypothetical protein